MSNTKTRVLQTLVVLVILVFLQFATSSRWQEAATKKWSNISPKGDPHTPTAAVFSPPPPESIESGPDNYDGLTVEQRSTRRLLRKNQAERNGRGAPETLR